LNKTKPKLIRQAY